MNIFIMKKKAIFPLFAFLFATVFFFSCTNQKVAANNGTKTESKTESVSSEKNYGGGKPWIDSMIKENVVKSQRPSPKDDFHLYVNYDWLMKNDIPEGFNNYGSFTEAGKEIEANIIEVLTDPKIPGLDAENVRALYSAILDWDSRNKVGIEPVLPVVEEIKNISTIDQLSDFITNPEKTFLVPTFVGVSNTVKLDDSSSYITEIGFEGFVLGDPAEYKKRTSIGERYYQAALYAAKENLPRVGYSKEEAEKILNDVLEIETILSANAPANAERHSPDFIKKCNNVFSPAKVKKLSVNFPLWRYIENYGYGDAKEFMVGFPKVFSDLDKIYCQDYLEQIKSYLIFKAVRNYLPFLDQAGYDVDVNAENIITGSSGKIPDEKFALDVVKGALATCLDKAYLTRYDLSDMKAEITKICQELISIYREMLTEETWLSEKTRKMAIEKLDNIKIHAIYPEKWIDYSGLSIKGLSYIDCIKAIDEYNRKLDIADTNGKVDEELWGTDNLLIPNAFYQPSENSINIIPGLLGKPFYSEDMSQEELLGGIGCVIGHEISHAFDTNGAQYDKDGNLNNWWTKADKKAFQKRADKLISYYDGITAWEGLSIDGKLIQTEAIADMAGVKAMLKYAKSIPDFNYEKFFEVYAVLWRRLFTPELDEYYTFNDPHPKNFHRTNVNLQQFDEFYETYGIEPGDNMYLAPEDRILIW